MSEKPVCKRTKVFVKHTTNECISMIKEINYKIDINTLHRVENIEQIEMNDIARISIRTSKPLFVDSYNANPTSMKVSIQSFMKFKEVNKTLIIGDMYEIGKTSLVEHERVLN